MKKKVFIAAGVTLGAVLLVGAAVFTTLNVAQAATRAGQVLAQEGLQRIFNVTGQVSPTEKGLVVVSVQPGGAAEKAGVKRGDILLKIDDQETNTYADYKTALSGHKAGDQVKLALTHGDTARTLTATLADNNGQADLGLTPFEGRLGFNGRGMGFGFSSKGQDIISGTQTIVVSVTAGSPADKAGLKRGDVIVSVDSKKLDASNVLSDVISSYKPGAVVTLQVISQGQSQRDVKVTLGENPNKAGSAYLGVSYREIGPRMQFSPGQMMPFTQSEETGAVIVSVTSGSPADKAGLKQGDTITAIDGTSVSSPQALSKAVSGYTPGDTVTLSVKHSDGSTTDVKVTLGENPNKAGSAYLGVATSTGFNRTLPNGQQGMPRSQNRGGRNGSTTEGQTQPSAPLGDSL